MFEIGTAEASSLPSSPSASSDVTSPAIQAQQITECMEKIKRLETENKVLQGRIRGYKTLGDLLQEAKEENKKLVEEKSRLQQKLDSSFTPQTNTDHTLSLVDHQAQPAESTSLTLNQTPSVVMPTVGNPQQKKTESRSAVEMTERSVSSSLHSSNDNTEIPLDASHVSMTVPREVTPMQESMVDTQNDLSKRDTGNISQEVNVSQNLELDSDRFEEPEYEKVGHQMTYKASSMSSSMSVISSGPDDKYNFPSLSSGTSRRQQDVRPKTYNDFDHKPSTSYQETELSTQMRQMLQLHSTEEPELAIQLRKMSEDIAKTEENFKKFKNLAHTFAQENQKLKTSTQLEMTELRNQNFELREENKHLLQRVKQLEHDNLAATAGASLTSQTEILDWVPVDRPEAKAVREDELFQQGADTSLPDDVGTLLANVRQLRKQKKQLQDANSSWNVRWRDLQEQWESKAASMRDEVNRYKQELNEVQERDKQRQQDCEKLVQNAKSQAHEEENAKEEALTQLHMTSSQLRALQEEMSGLKCRLADMTREKHGLEAEVRVLKSRQQESLATHYTLGQERTVEELKTEIQVLRQQLTVFEEDFDRERQDRAAAQSLRDDLQGTVDKLKQEKEAAIRKWKILDQRLKSHEAAMQQTIQRNENLQSQLRDTKSQNQMLLESVSQHYQPTYINQTFPQSRVQPNTQANFQPNMGMMPQQPMPPYSPQAQMGAPGFSPQGPMPIQGFMPSSPQHQGYNGQMYNQQFVNYTPTSQQVSQGPGRWACAYCTYANIASRSVCEMCGKINRNQGQQPQFGFGSTGTPTNEVLMSRDVVNPQPLPRGMDVPDENGDLVTDNGLFQ